MSSTPNASSASRVRSILRTDHSKPVAWQNSLAVGLGILFGAIFGLLVDRLTGDNTVLLSGLCGMFLGLLTVIGPFVMALRLVLTSGVLMILVAALGVAAVDRPWLAVAGMVFLVFVATLWTALPTVGMLLGTFPTIVYLLILAKGSTLTGSADEVRAMLGAAAGLLGAIVTLLILTGPDIRKQTRRVAAKAWSPDVTWSELGTILPVLRLDAAPRALLSLTQAGIIAMITRTWLSDQKDTPAYQSAIKAQAAIADTLLPKGPLSPRSVTPPLHGPLTVLEEQSRSAGTPRDSYIWKRWRGALSFAGDVLAGTAQPVVVPFSSRSLSGAVVRSVVRPQSASFRYGVQRAVTLGIATFVMVSTDIPQLYWVLLALFSIMQTDAGGTFTRAVRYAVGTWLGAVGAVAVSSVLPTPVVAALACALMIAGFAWMSRNFAIMAAAMAFAVVLLTGLPDGQFIEWAALRALDITVAAVIAVAVSSFVLKVRPQPDEHVAAAKQALLGSVDELRHRLSNPQDSTAPALNRESDFLLQQTNIESDMAMMKDPEQVEGQLHALQDANSRVVALATIIFSGHATATAIEDKDAGRVSLVESALDALGADIRGIGSD